MRPHEQLSVSEPQRLNPGTRGTPHHSSGSFYIGQTDIFQIGIKDINILLPAVTSQAQGDTAPHEELYQCTLSESYAVLAAGLKILGIVCLGIQMPEKGQGVGREAICFYKVL